MMPAASLFWDSISSKSAYVPHILFHGNPFGPKIHDVKAPSFSTSPESHMLLICFSIFPIFYQDFLIFYPVSPSFPLVFPQFSHIFPQVPIFFRIFSRDFPRVFSPSHSALKDVTSFSCIVTSAAQASWRLALSSFKETMNRVGAQGAGWAG